jgi:hypothetical protein
VALPPEDTEWPPPLWDPIARDHLRWSAWFSGVPDQLSAAYLNVSGNSRTAQAFFRTTGEASATQPRPGAYRGGFLGNTERWFWGLRTPPGEKRAKLHVPVAGDIASMSSALLFAKHPRFETTDPAATAGTKAWLEKRFDDDLHASMLEAAELCSGLGGVFLRTVYDTAVSDKPWIDLVHADAAIPEFRHGKLISVTFWRVLDDTGDDVVRHLEQHDLNANVIYHGVYIGDQDNLGAVAPITEYPGMEVVAAQLDTSNAQVFPDLPPDVSTVTYIPNMRPNRVWRHIAGAAPLGRSDYAGVEGLMDSLDEAYSSWMRDLRLAKARLIVPPEYLDNIGPGKGAIADVEREVMVPMNLLVGSADAQSITANQFGIRVQEHMTTCQELTNAIVRSAGYAPQTFGDDTTGSAMTATEIENRERRTLLTRSQKLLYWRPGLADALYSLQWLERTVFGRTDIVPVRPDVVFPDAVLPSMQELAQTAVALNTAEAASKQTLVAMIHPDWTPDMVDQEVERIRDEQAFDVLGRARVTLAPPMGSTATVGQEVDDIASTVQILADPALDRPDTDTELQQ